MMFLSILLNMSISFACGITKLVRGITIDQQDQYNANWNIIVIRIGDDKICFI